MALYELVLPKMGESIIEATIIAWHKSIGDSIEEDEIILEIATDKVDSEVPCPVSGVLIEIVTPVDSVVSIGNIVAIIETNVSSIKSVKTTSAPTLSTEAASSNIEGPENIKEETNELLHASAISNNRNDNIEQSRLQTEFLPPLTQNIPAYRSTASYPSQLLGRWFSPLVRNIARANGLTVDQLSLLKGTGPRGRVTKSDILLVVDAYSSQNAPKDTQKQLTHAQIAQTVQLLEVDGDAKPFQLSNPIATDESTKKIPMDRTRRLIAQHMVQSVQTSPHVTSVVEANVSNIVQWRNRVKDSFEAKLGERLTYSPILAEVVIKAIREFPLINARLEGDNIILNSSIHLGIATAMDSGNLVVPVIKKADELNLLGLTKAMNDLTARARTNQLRPDEIQGGSFTISNIGTFNNLIGTPIINQPQLAILAIGAIQKRAIVEETSQGDIISIRHMMYLSLSFDHRVIDGFLGGTFLNRIVHYIEHFDDNREI